MIAKCCLESDSHDFSIRLHDGSVRAAIQIAERSADFARETKRWIDRATGAFLGLLGLRLL